MRFNNGGDSDDDLKKLGRYNNGEGYHHVRVGSYLPNAWGLYDMHGNIWEWCLNWAFGKNSGTDRVLRGGCWYESKSGSCSSTAWYINKPDARYGGWGFRLVVNLPE